MLKRFFTVVIIGTLGRFFNNPQIVYRLEDKLANSSTIRQLARTIVAIMERGTWELRQFKSFTDFAAKQKELGQGSTISDSQADLMRKYRKFQDELKRRASKRL